MIRFLHNNKTTTLENLDPNTTVLNYLRSLGHTGTKEGCASGDCGACTVVLAEKRPNSEALNYRAINSCLTLLPALDGKQLITVENLQKGHQLHPVQQAMVDQHASQCGFCTPGFVMSLFALCKNTPSGFTREETELALGGNLCRCTGYQPILNAAHSLCEQSIKDQFNEYLPQTLDELAAITPSQQHSLSDGQHRAFSPTTTSQLCELLRLYPDARIVAGGTDLVLEITQQHKRLEALVYIGLIKELKSISHTDEALTIGAATPLSECAAALAEHLPDFAELIHRFASLQIRNHGTLGGNIANASPIGDSPPALIAAGASIKIHSADRTRIVKLDAFFKDYKKTDLTPGEFIESIIIPRLPDNTLYKIYKVSKRLDDDISAVLGAFRITLTDNIVTDCCIAFGGMAAIPKRALNTEHFLMGKPWTEETILSAKNELAKDFSPLSDFRASAQYRSLVAANLLEKFWLESQSSQNSTRVTDHSLYTDATVTNSTNATEA